MRVVRVIARLNVGGPARHVVLLNAGLQSRGHETLLVHGSADPAEGTLEHLAAQQAVRTQHVPHLGRRVTPLSDLRAFAALLSIVFREQPDIVHTHTAKAGALGRIAAFAFNATHMRRRRCVVVHTYHGHVLEGYFHPLVNTTIRIVERALARVTDRLVTISPGQRRDIVERFRIGHPRQTATIPLGLDLAPLFRLRATDPNLRSALRASDDDVIVGYVGRLVPIKDLPTLVQAFALAVRQDPRLRLVLVGDGPERSRIAALVRELGLEARVTMMGWNEDLGLLYATFDIVALSSLNEGTPVAIIEAMAAAKAVVATKVGGVPDVIEEGITGLLVPPRSPECMAQSINRLAADDRERREIGERARSSAMGRFSCERLVGDVEDLYREALAEKRMTNGDGA